MAAPTAPLPPAMPPADAHLLLAAAAEAEAGEATSYSSEAPETDGGSLASDEALQALREKLTGGN